MRTPRVTGDVPGPCSAEVAPPGVKLDTHTWGRKRGEGVARRLFLRAGHVAVGTLRYMAPELLTGATDQDGGNITNSIDIFR